VIDRNERVWPKGALKSKLPKPGKNSRVRFDGALCVDAKLANRPSKAVPETRSDL